MCAQALANRAEGAYWRWLSPALLAGVFGLLAAWSWGKWTDPHIDFGNELYIPWRIVEGQALYADIAHRNGPLSHYVNALWFGLFGVSVRTLVFCNLAILSAICALTFRIFRVACGRPTATAVCCVQLGVFGFSQYAVIGNFNYVTPYQHYQTHGVALSLLMIVALLEAVRRGSTRWCALAGGCLGLVFLGKVELFVPAAMTAFAGLAILLAADGSRSQWRDVLAAFALGAAVPVLVALGLLAQAMPVDQALRGLVGNWSHLGGSLRGDPFYRSVAGFEAVGRNGLLVLRMAMGVTLVAAVFVGVDRLSVRRSLPPAWAVAGASAVGLALFAALVMWPQRVPWQLAARALPLTTLCIGAALWSPRLRPHFGLTDRDRWLPLALWSVLSLALLAKMILKVKIGHYGFVLAMPATLLLVAACLSLVPDALGRRWQGGGLARVLGLAVVGAGVAFFWTQSRDLYAQKDFRLGKGADEIRVRGLPAARRGPVLARTLALLEQEMSPEDTLLVLPEGVILNYWLRRVNPTRFNLFLPTEIEAFGGADAVLEEIRATPPDYIVLAHRASAEFGVGPFGRDPRNGRRLLAWIRAHYAPVGRIGSEPFVGKGFGTVVLRRKAASLEEPSTLPAQDAGAANGI